VPEAPAAHLRFEPAVRREGRGVLHLSANFNYRSCACWSVLMAPSMVSATTWAGYEMLLIDVPLFAGDRVGGQLLHGLPARAARRLDDAPEIPAVLMSIGIGLTVNNTKASSSAPQQADDFERTPEVPHRGERRRVGSQEVPRASWFQPLIELTLASTSGNGLLRTRQRHLRTAAVPGPLQIGFLYTGSSPSSSSTPAAAWSSSRRQKDALSVGNP